MEAAQHPWPALGVLLLRDGLVTKDELNAILDGQRDSRQLRITGSRLGEILVDQGVVSAAQVARLLAEQYELPFVELVQSDIDVRVAQTFSIDQARRFSALPINRRPDGSYDVAIADPSTVVFSDELRGILGSTVHFVVVGNDAIADAITGAFNRPDVVVDDGTNDHTTVVALASVEDEQDAFDRARTLAQLWPPLGALLVRDGLVTDGELDAALAQQRLSTSQRLGEILVERGVVSPSIVARLVAEQYELPFAVLDDLEVDLSTARLLPEATARRYRAVPIRRHVDGSVEVAIADPTNIFYTDDLHTELDAPLRLVVAPPDEIDGLVARAYGHSEADEAPRPPTPPEAALAEVEPQDEHDAYDLVVEHDDHAGLPVVTEAYEHDVPLMVVEDPPTSDEPTTDSGLPRWPTEKDDAIAADVFDEVFDPEALVDEAETAIAERELWVVEAAPVTDVALDQVPTYQDSESSVSLSDESADDLAEAVRRALAAGASALHLSHRGDVVEIRVRVSGAVEAMGSYAVDELPGVLGTLSENPDLEIHALPTARGTKITVSVVERAVAPTSIAELGLTADAERALRAALAETGLLVVTSPPGSGATSTLYAALDVLATIDRVVMTVEDRVARLFDGVDQTEVDALAGMTYASAIRQLSQMDTDVVLVGALPDDDSVVAALRCAVAGRHVLAGMNERDAPSALARLLEIAGDSGRLASALTCVISQQLVPRVCDHCRETYYASESELAQLGLDSGDGRRLLARGRGCRTCAGTGYHGRTAVFEVLTVTDELRELARRGATASRVRDAAASAGAATIRDEIVRLCLEGLTTTAELDELTEAL